jgi:hypothetical protein
VAARGGPVNLVCGWRAGFSDGLDSWLGQVKVTHLNDCATESRHAFVSSENFQGSDSKLPHVHPSSPKVHCPTWPELSRHFPSRVKHHWQIRARQIIMVLKTADSSLD